MKGIGMEPEPVHKIEVRAEGRQGICVTANERSKETVLGEPGNPMGKGRRSQAFGNHKEKKDKGTQDLRLILSGSAGMVVKRQDNVHGFVGIQKQEFLAKLAKFSMETDPFGRIRRNFKIVEKTFVVFHRLPVFYHSAGLLVNK